MKKIILFVIFSSVITFCQSQVKDGGGGFSFSYSINNAWGADMFARSGNNRFHLGYGHQFNGQEIEVVKKQKETVGVTEIGNGEYFWVIDLGYSRIFIDKITVHSEISIGGKNQYTSFKNDRSYPNGYFGVMVPPVSVKQCHFKRYYNYIKNYSYSFFKAPFLNDSPLRSIRCEELTILSNIASAIVPSPIISYHADTGI